MSNKPILFFSRKCQNCQALWSRLQQENRLNDFIKICIEDNPSKIPPMIKSVPTIYIKDRQPIVGSAINLFLNSPMASAPPAQVSQQQPPSHSQPTNQAPPQTQTSTNGLGGIGDYNPVEMSSNWSDSYSFIQDNPCPMGFCFDFLGGNEQNTNGQQSGSGNNAPNKFANNAQNMKLQRTNDFNKRLEELQASRNNL
jgi:hypothetical protein